MKKIVLLLVVFFLIGVAALFGGIQQMNSVVAQGDETVTYQLKKGAGLSSVAQELDDLRLVKNNLIFKVYTRATKFNKKLKAGTYKLSQKMSQLEVLEELTKGTTIDSKLTFQEGLNINTMAQMLGKTGRFDSDEFLRLFRDKELVKEILGMDVPSFEGYLFPETYFYNENTRPIDLIRLMTKNFEANYQKSLVGAKLKLDKVKHVVLASMIEKETGAPEERPLISSVFHNRIKKGMKLQSDPTILYGIFDKTGVYPTNIRKKDILAKTRYNTYAVPGLPYGPIANPGLESLKAAVNPVVSDKYYFVSRNDGTHVFSATLKQHNLAVNKYQRNRKAREGKSWRDLKKKKK